MAEIVLGPGNVGVPGSSTGVVESDESPRTTSPSVASNLMSPAPPVVLPLCEADPPRVISMGSGQVWAMTVEAPSDPERPLSTPTALTVAGVAGWERGLVSQLG